MTRPFFRMVDPVRVPVSLTSAATPYEMTSAKLPPNAKSFMFINPCPFDIRLRGSGSMAAGAPGDFVAVTDETGWLIPARMTMGVFTSQMPKYLSVKAKWWPWMPAPANFDYAECFLELVYGEGE